MSKLHFHLLALVGVLSVVTAAVGADQSREQEALDTAVDAYVYLYPLVTMDVTRVQLTNVPEEKAKGPQGPMASGSSCIRGRDIPVKPPSTAFCAASTIKNAATTIIAP